MATDLDFFWFLASHTSLFFTADFPFSHRVTFTFCNTGYFFECPMASVSQIKLFTHKLYFLSSLFDAWFDLQLSSTFLKVASFTVAVISLVCILSCIFSCDLNGYILINAEFCESSSLSDETEYTCPAWLVTVSSRNR